MKKGRKNKSSCVSNPSPLTSAFYMKLGYSREVAENMAQLFAEFDEFEREFALDYLSDIVAKRDELPIKRVVIDGKEVPVIETSENGETLFISAYGYEDAESVSFDDIEIDGPTVSLVKMPYGDTFRREGIDDNILEDSHFDNQKGGKKMSMKPIKNSGQIFHS